MSGLDLEVKNFDMFKGPPYDTLAEDLGAKGAAKTAAVFSEWLRDNHFGEVFTDRTGKTRKSIGMYRTKAKVPTYLVRPGVGIPGMLNYLYGEARGSATSRSGKPFSFTRKRDVVNEGWKVWKSNASKIFEETAERYMKKIGGAT